jgi:hypothetical protein
LSEFNYQGYELEFNTPRTVLEKAVISFEDVRNLLAISGAVHFFFFLTLVKNHRYEKSPDREIYIGVGIIFTWLTGACVGIYLLELTWHGVSRLFEWLMAK